MKWPWNYTQEEKQAIEENQREIENVKTRLDNIESIDIIAEELAVLQRNGD